MPAPIRSTWYNRPGWSEYKAARGGGQKHWGYDSYCAPRTTIYAIGAGRVVARATTNSTQYGYYVDVFYPGLNVRQREAHMNERSPLPVGTLVTSTTALGRVGRTGNAKNIYWIRNGIELWHVHSQAWRGNTTNGDLNVDPRNYWGGTASGDITPIEGDEMSAEAESRIAAIYAALFGPRNIGSTKPLSWLNIDGSAQNTKYGVLPIILHNQNLIARQSGQVAALTAAVNALAAGEGVDPATILNAARDGAAEALADIDITVDTAAIVEAVRTAIAEQGVTVDLSALEATLQEQFAAVNANIDQIPTGFEITPK